MQKVYYYEGYDRIEFVKKLVDQGYYGDLPCGVLAAINWEELADQLEYDGYYEVPGVGVIYTGVDPFEIKETEDV